jgi:hypothetical protein
MLSVRDVKIIRDVIYHTVKLHFNAIFQIQFIPRRHIHIPIPWQQKRFLSFVFSGKRRWIKIGIVLGEMNVLQRKIGPF